MNRDQEPGLYIHVPFCVTKCPYCDFYSVTSHALVDDWLGALGKEVLLYRDRFFAFDSLYLGGGTPSLLSPPKLTILMDYLLRSFTFYPEAEITLEANPDDITLERLTAYRDLGVNRISLGVQSFEEQELRLLQRRHTGRQAEKALEMIGSSGFFKVGIDLIWGFPGQAERHWQKTLLRALDFKPEHLSCYEMTYKKGTLFGEQVASNRIKPLGAERGRSFYLRTSHFLENQGYLHYEISNFARQEQDISRHNSKYWLHGPYLGLGPGAHSFNGEARWWNVKSVEGYCRLLEGGKKPIAGTEVLSSGQHFLEELFLGFRTRNGIDLTLIKAEPQWEKVLENLEKSGLVNIKEGRIIPTRKGFVVADNLPLLLLNGGS
jgi:oxygen-independent coproporphyrinogen-3 oxidase